MGSEMCIRDRVYRLIDDKKFADAATILKGLAQRKPRSLAIAEASMVLHQASGNHEACSVAARKMMKLSPDDPGVVAQYAQMSLFCGRACLASIHFQRFLDRWPDHPSADVAKKAIQACRADCQERVETTIEEGFTDKPFEDGGLELYALHESSIERLQNLSLIHI